MRNGWSKKPILQGNSRALIDGRAVFLAQIHFRAAARPTATTKKAENDHKFGDRLSFGGDA